MKKEKEKNDKNDKNKTLKKVLIKKKQTTMVCLSVVCWIFYFASSQGNSRACAHAIPEQCAVYGLVRDLTHTLPDYNQE